MVTSLFDKTRSCFPQKEKTKYKKTPPVKENIDAVLTQFEHIYPLGF